jgi:formylglycine-generating enzyme required for sulfatase activity
MLRAEDRIGPYTLVRRLGQGSFGVVWLAERRGKFLTTQVALKIPTDDEPDLQSIRQEAQAWLQASGHPNVLPVLDADEYDGQVVIVSEYAPDGTLAEWIKSHGGKAPTPEAAIGMAVGILSGLEHLHSRKMIHRDLKPGNVLLQGETPRLSDFGVSRILRTVASTNVAGTPAYMAPEMFDGDYSEQTDLWAVGVMLYRMISGELPFAHQGWGALYAAIKEDEPQALPAEVPSHVRSAIAKALAKDPAERFESALSMKRSILSTAFSGPATTFAPRDAIFRDAPTHRGTVAERPVFPGYDLPQPAGPLSSTAPAVATPFAEASASSATGSRPGSEASPRYSFWPFSKNPPPMRGHDTDGAELAWIAPGEFAMGDADQPDNPRRRVALEGFWIYRCPVTVSMYRVFAATTDHPMPEPPPWGWINDHPMVNVQWQDAVAYCKWARVSIPTEAQWEKASRGLDARKFPWGGNWDPNRCRCSRNNYADAGSTVSVGTYPMGASPFGIMDMAGNVWEWCHEMADNGASQNGADAGPRRVLRGGSWEGKIPADFRTSFRQRQFPSYMYYTIGFRCVLNGDPP